MIAKFFASGGALDKAIPGFQARQPQIDMAKAVDDAICEQTQLVVEAGTGTGKTFAYLVPALVRGKKNDYQYRFKESAGTTFSSRFAFNGRCPGFYRTGCSVKRTG